MTTLIPSPWPTTAEPQIKACLNEGGTMAFPTETVYGLGGNAFSEELVEKIFQLKQRPRDKPLLLLIDKSWLPRLSTPLSPQTQSLITRFWPGPLTLILPAHPELPQFLVGPNHTIAVRYSSSAIVQQLIAIGQCPLIGTSANFSQSPENTQASGVLTQLGDKLDLLIDGGPTLGQHPSTIVNTTTAPFQILRSGALSQETLQPHL